MIRSTSAASKRLPLLLGLSLALLATAVVPWTATADEATLDRVFTEYARYGADVWAENPGAKISGEGQACISCHTSLPYALVEPLLPGEYAAYEDLIANVDQRVLTWADNTPWYSDEKLVETAALSGMPAEILIELLDADDSRGVEAVFNALILAMHDAYAGTGARPQTERAFENMWEAQIQTGAASGRWGWIRVNLVPWEVVDSDIWGASLGCIAAAMFPDLAPAENARLLHATLREAATDETISLHTKAAVLWCDAEMGGQLLDAGTKGAIVAGLIERQHENGGWALRELGPWVEWEGSRADCCPQREIRPDAYATGVVTLALARSGHPLVRENQERMDNAVAWIERELVNPYPSEPRHNRHDSADADLPEFRNQLYTNAGHMWAYLARTIHLEGTTPWASR